MQSNKFCYPTLVTIFTVFLVTTLHAQDSENTIGSVSASLKGLTIEELLDVEVSSVSRRVEKLGETASAIQVITHEEIRRSGATSLPEALRLATNLQVAQVNSSQWSISARGFNNVLANKLLVMIDGRTVYTPLYAGVFWDVQNFLLEDVERIEVISGPGGTLWGSNAVNGVINIITKNAKDTQGLIAEVGMGNELQTYGGIRYGGKFNDKLHYRAYATGFKRAGVSDLENKNAEDDWTMSQGGVQLNWEPTGNNRLTLQSNVYDTRPNPDGNPTSIKARGQNVLGRWTHTKSATSEFRVQLYYDRTSRDFRNGFRERLNTYDADGQHKFDIGKANEIIWGFGVRIMDHAVDNLELFRFEPDEKTLLLYSLFVQDRITVVDERLDLTLGIKAEHNRYTGMLYQPGVRLAFKNKNNQLLWAAVARAMRTPARIDREFYLNATPEIPLIAGNKNFKSESLLSYELGWRLQLASSSVSIAAFYNRYNDLRSAEPGPPPFNIPVTFGNGVEGNSYGVELSGTYEPVDWLRINGGYTFLSMDLRAKQASRDLNDGSAESNDPKHQFLIQTMIDPARAIAFSFTTRYVDNLPEPRVAAYWELDARFAWRPYAFLEFSIVGQNLLHDKHIEFIPASPEPRYIERSVYGKVLCRF